MANLLAWAIRWIRSGSDPKDDASSDAETSGVESLQPNEDHSGFVELEDSPVVQATTSQVVREWNPDESIKAGSRAYDYVTRKLGAMAWQPPLNTPQAVASWLDIPEDSLAALCKGDLRQMSNIREALKELFQGSRNEHEIDRFLTPPPPVVA